MCAYGQRQGYVCRKMRTATVLGWGHMAFCTPRISLHRETFACLLVSVISALPLPGECQKCQNYWVPGPPATPPALWKGWHMPSAWSSYLEEGRSVLDQCIPPALPLERGGEPHPSAHSHLLGRGNDSEGNCFPEPGRLRACPGPQFVPVWGRGIWFLRSKFWRSNNTLWCLSLDLLASWWALRGRGRRKKVPPLTGSATLRGRVMPLGVTTWPLFNPMACPSQVM